MKSQATVWIGVIFCLFGTRALAGDASVPPKPFIQRLKPAGGWAPYGGGLLRWWPRHCFPNCGAPDDYCRKTPPPVCRPPYPCYYIYGAPEICCPRAAFSSCATH